MLFGNFNLAQLIATGIALLVAFTIHEATHALVAYRLGDATAQRAGRLSLNPAAHLDPMGTLMVLVAGVGWGKPVPGDPRNLHPGGRAGMGLVAGAGPLSNLIMAFVFAAPFRAGMITWGMMGDSAVIPGVGQVLLTIVTLNVYLALFNLLPIAPLDGFNVAMGILPESAARVLWNTQRYGPIILLFLILSGRFIRFDLLGATLLPAANAILRLFLG